MKTKSTYLLKDITEQEYKDAPEDVRKAYISVAEGIPLSPEEKQNILCTYPEYFIKNAEKSFGTKVKRLLNLKADLVNKTRKSKKKWYSSKLGKINPRKITSIQLVPKDQVEFPSKSASVDSGLSTVAQ